MERTLIASLWLPVLLCAFCPSCDDTTPWENSLVFGTGIERPDPMDPSQNVLLGQGNSFSPGNIAFRLESEAEFGNRFSLFRFVGTTAAFEISQEGPGDCAWPVQIHVLWSGLRVDQADAYEVRAFLVDCDTRAETLIATVPLEIISR